jgi:phenylacetic acid degradation protein paaN
MTGQDTRNELTERHQELLDRAVEAIDSREFFSPFPESPSPKVYGEGSAEAGEAAFQQLLGSVFELGQPGEGDAVITPEKSPYGLPLDVGYRPVDPTALVAAAKATLREWRDAGPRLRASVAVEILHRLNKRSFEMAHAVHHTTGQPFVMAFQAGGPNAQDRALEAVAYAYAEQTRQPTTALWSKPQRKGEPLTMEKTFTAVPRGVALLIACNTFPTWNGYPGLFASLVTGNPVIVKPHPGAVLPLALSVRIARDVLAEAGFSPDIVTLAAEEAGGRVAAELAVHPDVRIVDFTGSTEFGDWLETNARQAVVYTEKAGLNTVVVDSTDNYKGLLSNLAFSLSLYSGQMCTTPQNILIPGGGVTTDQGLKSPAEFGTDLGAALDKLLADPERAAGTLGSLANDDVRARLDSAAALGPVLHASTPVGVSAGDIRTPLVVALTEADEKTFTREWFGPVSFVITTENTARSVEVFRTSVSRHGALTASVYSTSEEVLAAVREAALDAGVHLSENLTGAVFVNQSAAFSDFHGTGANPAATATLTDPGFVTGRYFMVQSRRHVDG